MEAASGVPEGAAVDASGQRSASLRPADVIAASRSKRLRSTAGRLNLGAGRLNLGVVGGSRRAHAVEIDALERSARTDRLVVLHDRLVVEVAGGRVRAVESFLELHLGLAKRPL